MCSRMPKILVQMCSSWLICYPSLPASSADCEQGFSLTKVIRPLLCSKSSSESDDEMESEDEMIDAF